jgi:hypothetical protein
MVLLTLLDDILNDLVDWDIKRLNIASTATKNNRDCSIELLQFVNQIGCLFFVISGKLEGSWRAGGQQEGLQYNGEAA